MSVRIIVDSGTDLPEQLLQQVTVLPLTVRFGETEYADGVDLTPVDFYEKLSQAEALPTTSQITPDRFARAFEEVVAAGDTAVVITLSGELSGTYQSAMIAAGDFEDKIFVVDSRMVAIGCGVLAAYALELSSLGKSAEEIAKELTEIRQDVCVYAMVDTLEYLKKGGRISAAVALAGGLLGIKPVVGIHKGEGRVEMFGKGRGYKQASKILNDLTFAASPRKDRPILLGFTGANDENLQKYMEENKEIWGQTPAYTIIGSAIGTHVGPGAVAVAFFKSK